MKKFSFIVIIVLLVLSCSASCKDDSYPVLAFNTDTFYYCPNKKILNNEVSAYDEIDGDITDKINVEFNNNNITFSVTDNDGNITKSTKKGILKDEEAPVITLNGEETIYLFLGDAYTEEGVDAVDNCDEVDILITGSVDTNKVGVYTVTYTAMDKSKNESSINRYVYVYDKVIYLTFDDGPGPYTNELLDILAKYNVKATFFVTDQNLTKGYDDVILRAYNEGHTIGLHTSSHDYSIYTNTETYFNDLYAIQDKVRRITGKTTFIMRFPGGSSNTISEKYDDGTKIMSSLTKMVSEEGFIYFDWNVDSGDTSGTTDENIVYENVINAVKENGTYVVLQHDIKHYSVLAVEKIIEYGLSNGYLFLPLKEDSPTVHHRVLN